MVSQRAPLSWVPSLPAIRNATWNGLSPGITLGPTESPARSAYMLTAKGVEFLGKCGAGLDEA